MKEIPILFSTPMVQAELDGRKTLTRRTTSLDTINRDPNDWQFEWAEPFRNIWTFTQKSSLNEQSLADKTFNQVQLKCPYGRPGDILWVRETCVKACEWDGNSEMPPLKYYYKADDDWQKIDEWYNEKTGKTKESPTWKPSIHMPKEAARIWLQVESIRVERLKDISDGDAIAEGIESYNRIADIIAYKNYSEFARKDFLNVSSYNFDNGKEIQSAPVASFCTLWIDINGRDSWISNPWVWVVSFKVLSTTGKPDLNNL